MSYTPDSRHQLEDPRRFLEVAFQRPPDSAEILQGERKIRKGRPHAHTVLFPSRKNGNAFIACEGRLEADLALCLELHPNVTAYRGQPIALPGPHGRNVVPDFAAIVDDRYIVIDVKPQGRLNDPRVTERMRHVRELLAEFGIAHYIVTNESLHEEPQRQIRQQLRKGLPLDLTVYQRDQLLEALGDRLLTVAEFRDVAVRMSFSPLIVETLAARGALTFTTGLPWRQTTLIGAHHGSTHSHPAGRGTVQDLFTGI